MASLDSVMEVLGALTAERPELSIQDIADITGRPTSTSYRVVRELLLQGWLTRSREGYYRLGTAFLAYERVLRLSDPVVRLGQRTIVELLGKLEIPCRGLVSCLYGETVMCVADASVNAPTFTSSYERGRPMPLNRGATSKVILATLPLRLRKKLMGSVAESERDQLDSELQEIRQRGVRVSREEVDPGIIGIAVPFIVGTPTVFGSLSLVLDARYDSEDYLSYLTKLLSAARDTLETLIEEAA